MKYRLMAVAVAAMVVLAACGSDGESSSGTTTSAPDRTSASDSPDTTEAPADVSDLYELKGEMVDGSEFAVSGTPKVHFAQYWSGVPILADWKQVLEDEVDTEYPDWELSVSDAQNDPTRLVTDIENAINRGVDVIIVQAGDGQVPVPAVEKAVSAGIPVIAMQKRINTDAVTVTVVADDVAQGEDQAEALVAALEERNGAPEGKVIIVNGIPGASLTVEQNDGFHSVIDQHDDIEVVCDQPANYQPDLGASVLENCLQATPDADAVWYVGTDLGPALANTIEQVNGGETILVGGGGSANTLQLMASSDIIVYDQVFPNCVRPALAAAARLLAGESVASEILVRGVGVTPSGVDSYLDSSRKYVDWPPAPPTEWTTG